VTQLAKLPKSHGIYLAATKERTVGGRSRIHNEATDPAARLRIVSRSVSGTHKDLLVRIFHGTGPCVADRSIAAVVMDNFFEACILASNEQPSRSKRARSRFVDDAAVDSDDEDELVETGSIEVDTD
jgi:hypothetical protein